ncbi:MAG: citrate/2-methylcitrate synthase [Candidatus Omnitrophota bacterium]
MNYGSADSENKKITQLIIEAGKRARKETSRKPESTYTNPVTWPIQCLVGPGLEGAIACESKVGYVNGSQGWLIYRGYDIFDLCAHSNFEEVSYLLLHGSFPSGKQLKDYTAKLRRYQNLCNTIRFLMGFPVERMNAMAALRIGVTLMRLEFTDIDSDSYEPDISTTISVDEDSIPMETIPRGEAHAIYEFKKKIKRSLNSKEVCYSSVGLDSCYHLLSGVAVITGAVARIRGNMLPISADPKLRFAANLIYMITGRRPTPLEERIMDVALILHADHGMNASTFSTMVVASTLSDIYFAVGSGIAALNGSLHGGANERVLHMLKEIGSSKNVKKWYKEAISKKKKIMGFGHRVYKAYDPRARILGPLADYLVNAHGDRDAKMLLRTAQTLEKEVVSTLGAQKKIFPNVDFYSGIVYSCLGIPVEMFTPVFAVSRVSGWTARVVEYLEHNRIFRPRAVYTGPLNKKYKTVKEKGE